MRGQEQAPNGPRPRKSVLLGYRPAHYPSLYRIARFACRPAHDFGYRPVLR
ncbi:MAG TPA: hypothetical protein VNK05_11430 [Chloroflexota bacterium]|nr:hypothetical protein [Chloroflexota bacterium]